MLDVRSSAFVRHGACHPVHMQALGAAGLWARRVRPGPSVVRLASSVLRAATAPSLSPGATEGGPGAMGWDLWDGWDGAGGGSGEWQVWGIADWLSAVSACSAVKPTASERRADGVVCVDEEPGRRLRACLPRPRRPHRPEPRNLRLAVLTGRLEARRVAALAVLSRGMSLERRHARAVDRRAHAQ